jgi:hypothetical protein
MDGTGREPRLVAEEIRKLFEDEGPAGGEGRGDGIAAHTLKLTRLSFRGKLWV